ncbi:MAG: Nif11 family protein [Prochlorococcaceae cyanobacterium]
MAATEDQALEQLQCFAACLDADPGMAALIRASQSPEQIVELAGSKGFAFNRQVMREQSSNLASRHWPWAGKGSAWRRQFFGG